MQGQKIRIGHLIILFRIYASSFIKNYVFLKRSVCPNASGLSLKLPVCILLCASIYEPDTDHANPE